MIDYTIDNIIDTLADFIEPICGRVQQAQVDRIPMPKGEFCILTPLRFTRLSTTRDIKQDTGNPSDSAMGYTEVRQADIQLDIYGDGAAGRALAIETIFSGTYGYEGIKAIDNRLSPLYSSAAIQAPFIDAESQWQERWVITLSLQAHITVSFPQDYFDKAEITSQQVDI
ncbi:phage neck terminator protein [Yokenella regensburgei]|uniref:phage neck terminator protein n=1 Tax=Yokenella regensburgei TaxID=158877 RepID=UPI003ED9F8F3